MTSEVRELLGDFLLKEVGEQLSKLQLSNPPKPLVCEVHHP